MNDIIASRRFRINIFPGSELATLPRRATKVTWKTPVSSTVSRRPSGTRREALYSWEESIRCVAEKSYRKYVFPSWREEGGGGRKENYDFRQIALGDISNGTMTFGEIFVNSGSKPDEVGRRSKNAIITSRRSGKASANGDSELISSQPSFLKFKASFCRIYKWHRTTSDRLVSVNRAMKEPSVEPKNRE